MFADAGSCPDFKEVSFDGPVQTSGLWL